MSESHLDLPNIDTALFQRPDMECLKTPERATHAPRFLLLYGSLRERSFSRLAAEEAARILRALGGETRLFNPSGLPLVDDASEDHPKVKELRELGVVCGRGRNPTLRLWPTIFSGKIDVFPGDRRSRLISSMTSVAPA